MPEAEWLLSEKLWTNLMGKHEKGTSKFMSQGCLNTIQRTKLVHFIETCFTGQCRWSLNHIGWITITRHYLNLVCMSLSSGRTWQWLVEALSAAWAFNSRRFKALILTFFLLTETFKMRLRQNEQTWHGMHTNPNQNRVFFRPWKWKSSRLKQL